MDKPAIKKFAIWARNKLKKDAEYCAEQIGITKEKIVPPLPQSTEETLFFDSPTGEPYKLVGKANIKKYRSLVELLKRESANKEYSAVYDSLIERAAYTWFNRMIAVRYMEVNDLLPSHTRVLSATDERKKEPQIVENPSEAILDYTPEEIKQIQDWQYNIGKNGVADMLFRMLFLKQCYALNEVLPKLFDNEDGYLELLLRINFTDADGVVYHLTHDIKEENWRADKTDNAVQIVGWLYQYYNTEPKEQVFANLKKNIKISKENIPAATQLFTPDWIVRYMVENSLGRLHVESVVSSQWSGASGQWSEENEKERIEKEKEIAEQMGWKYYLPEAEQSSVVRDQCSVISGQCSVISGQCSVISGQCSVDSDQTDHSLLSTDHSPLTTLKCIDPCMGSGHILAYLFDVLMQIYTAAGYSKRDAAASIVEHNLYGLDIDDRAAQMAYFVVMMKGCQYDSRFLRRHLNPHVYAIQESGELPQTAFGYCGPEEPTARTLWDTFRNAKEYGSILQPKVTLEELDKLEARLQEADSMAGYGSLGVQGLTYQLLDVMYPLIDQARMLVQKYDVVVTNPPYMGASNMNPRLNDFIKNRYPDYKSDFFSAFIVRGSEMTKPEGYCGYFTPYVWMFIQSYEKLREYLYTNATIETLIQFEYSAFEEATVPVCTFVFKNSHVSKKGCYLRLVDFRGGMEVQRQKTLEAIANHDCGFYYEQNTDNFSKIPGSPVAYWVSDNFLRAFDNEKIGKYAISDGQTKTGDNDKYLRLLWEVPVDKIGKGKHWVLHAKGGPFRRWYGNVDTLIDWSDSARAHYRADRVARIAPEYIWFRKGICWTLISSNKLHGFRLLDDNSTFNLAAPSVFFSDERMMIYILGYLNSKFSQEIIALLNPTLNTNIGDITTQPLCYGKSPEKEEKVVGLVTENIALSKSDWDAFETSWDFKHHPLV